MLPDGRILNRELVKLGFAQWYPEHIGYEHLKALEREARAAKLGLWQEGYVEARLKYMQMVD